MRTLGLVILAAFVVLVGVIGYVAFQSVMRDRAATDAALEVAGECESVVISGGTRTVEITVPGGYQMRFSDNIIFIDNHEIQPKMLGLMFAENSPQLEAGTYTLSVTVQENTVVVSRIL